MRKHLKIISYAIVLALIVAFSLTACSGSDDAATTTTTDKKSEAKGDSWAIYWYLCGSDLESDGGFATEDLEELMEVQLPENVQVVIETGGAPTWQNDIIDETKLQRYVYDSEGLTLVDEQPSASMGDADTLTDFLTFAKENYPAKKTAVVFWNHGGGSVTGVSFDELYDFDALTLDELYEAFENTWTLSEEKPPLELVGFDTCLMATVDVAATFSDIAHYMVASEETEPANGWLYSEWLSALGENPSMNGLEIGKIICDTYYEGCEAIGTEDNTTLSVTDLTKISPLLTAYDAFGTEALAAACDNPGFFSQFGRSAATSENYGGNTKEQGYTNMVDLGHLAKQSAELLPKTSNDVLSALDECVLYQVGGAYRTEATGLSCYYSYNGDIDDFNNYAKVGIGNAFKYLYSYELTGELDEDGMNYVKDMEVTELPKIENLTTVKWDDAPLTLDADGNSVLTLGKEANDILAGIGFQLFYMSEEDDLMILLGADNDIVSDWEKGEFKDNFRGKWGSIDNTLVYMELSFEGEDYNLYSVPVLLNEEEYNLQVSYDFKTEKWSILGARPGIDDNGMAGKELRLLKVGDKLTVVHYLATFEGEDEFEPYTMDSITVTDKTAFSEMELPDGKYSLVFEMTDAMGNASYSQAAFFDCAKGEIITTVQ